MPQESYPPSVIGKKWNSGTGTATAVAPGGGTVPAPAAKDLGGVITGGAPAVKAPTDAAYVGIAALRTQHDNVMAGQPAWTTGQYANLIIKPGDTTTSGPTGHAWWDGSTWQTGIAADEPDVPDEDIVIVPDGDPNESWTKAQIVQWLADFGVDINKKAQSGLSKVELLALVHDAQDTP